MLKDIFLILFSLITAPAETWKRISEKGEDEALFFRNFFYPFLAIGAVVTFLGSMFYTDGLVQPALKRCIVLTVSIFMGLFVAAFLLEEGTRKLLKTSFERDTMRIFCGYNIAFLQIIVILTSLIPDIAYLNIVALYLIYIVWGGVSDYLHIAEEKKVAYTAMASAILLLSPFIIYKVLLLLMPGTNL